MTVSRPIFAAAIRSTLWNQTFGLRPLPLRLAPQARDPARTGVVGREREQVLVQLVHRLVLVILLDHEADVFHAGMDVGLELGDIADLEVARRRGHHLHDADGADRAARVLVEPRFLVALRRHHDPVEGIAVAVFAEQLQGRAELAHLGLASRRS